MNVDFVTSFGSTFSSDNDYEVRAPRISLSPSSNQHIKKRGTVEHYVRSPAGIQVIFNHSSPVEMRRQFCANMLNMIQHIGMPLKH